MRHTQAPSSRLRRLALEQSDLLTTAQVLRHGMSKDALARLLRDGHWLRLAHGLLDTAPGHDNLAKVVWAAALQAGDPYAIGGDAALRLHGMDRPAGRVVVWVPDDRRPQPESAALIRRDKLDRVGRAFGEPVRIRVEDALVDVGQHLEIEHLVGILSDAVRQRLTTLPRIRRTVDGRRRVRRRSDFTEILDDLTGIESTLEYVYREDVERAHGLPSANRQDSMSEGTRTDVLYDEQQVLVEVDGRLGHEDSKSAFRDLDRDNRHASRELMTLRYGSADIRGRPCAVARQLWQTLHRRGLAEPFQKCPRCPGKWSS